MNAEFFIRRPYLAMVIAIVTTLCGIIAIFELPVAQYPQVAPPQVSVTTSWPGADASTLLNAVVEPLESQINGVRDMIYMSSNVSNSGAVNITVTFATGSDGQLCTQDVQSRVERALAQLPQTVQQEGVIVQEQSGTMLLAAALDSPDQRYDTLFLSSYASINMIDELSRLPGVAQVQLFGGSTYAMRLWLENRKLEALGIPVSEVLEAVKAQNVEVSAGSLGAAPAGADTMTRYTIHTDGRRKSVREFEEIVVRATEGGAVVRLRDVARVDWGAESYEMTGTLNSAPAAVIVIYQRSDANGIDVADNCRATFREMAKHFPPGMRCEVNYDSTTFVRNSIHDVAVTMGVAIVIVALTVFLFLQNWRMTLIPVLAIPVSIIGTFALLLLLGYSINLATLFALILAVGVVVDDAIIVIENVERLMTEEHLSPVDAASKSMRQISGAILATSSVLLAMFLPICFLSGISGELYRQFGVTISIAVVFSAVNALTLSPALSAVILRSGDRGEPWFVFRWFNRGFAAMGRGYDGFLKNGILRFGFLTLLVYGAFVALGVWMFSRLPAGFIPQEDQGVVFANMQMPSNSSLERTSRLAAEATRIIRDTPGVGDVLTISGFNIINMNPASGNAFFVATLKPWSVRESGGLSADRISDELQRKLYVALPEAFFMLFQPPPIPGIGLAGGFNFVLQSVNSDVGELKEYTEKLIGAAFLNPNLREVFCAWNMESAYLRLEINRPRAVMMGIDLEELQRMLSASLGTTYINNFNAFGQVYQVQAQSVAELRDTVEKLQLLRVANSSGGMVPLLSIATLSMGSAPESLSRYNMLLSSQIQGEPASGRTSGEAMADMSRLADEILPGSMRYSWTEMSYQEQLAGSRTIWVFALAVLFIYLFLAALYESWLLPFSALPTIPLVFPGAAFLLGVGKLGANLYTHVGVVLLFAMVCKTSILMIDFAKQHHDGGATALESALEAARLRFRAILMTAFAFILGTLPLAFATGPGAVSRRSIGCPVVGGMVGAIILLLLFVPFFYRVLQQYLDRRGK